MIMSARSEKNVSNLLCIYTKKKAERVPIIMHAYCGKRYPPLFLMKRKRHRYVVYQRNAIKRNSPTCSFNFLQVLARVVIAY